jgi:hypothetical protein
MPHQVPSNRKHTQRMITRTFLALLLTLLASPIHTGVAQTTNLLNNGSFETPGNQLAPQRYILLSAGDARIPGWVTTFNGAEYIDPSFPGIGNAHNPNFGVSQDGKYCIDLLPGLLNGGGVQQTFPTQIGQRYSVTLQLATSVGDGAGQPRLGTGSINVGVSGVTTNFAITNLKSFLVWTPKSFEFTASSNPSTLSISSHDNSQNHFAFIDNVFVAKSSTNSSVTIGLAPLITISGIAGESFAIEYVNDVGSSDWSRIEIVTLETPVYHWFDTSPAGANTRRFYRTVKLP